MKLIRLLFMVLLIPNVCLAQLSNENLLLSLPEGYKIDFQTQEGNVLMTEMVPHEETVHNWSEMVTSQVFLGLKNAMPEQFQTRMGLLWSATCKDGETTPVAQGEENGYAFSIWFQSCPLNLSTGKPEITIFKAVQGNDSFYVVQKAFKFNPSREQVIRWTQYFRSVTVCDSRLEDRLCPKVEQASQ